MIDGYRLGRKIGDGGMSTVYEAVQVSLNRVVALKVLSKEIADDEGAFRERFKRECEIQAELDHPHIVPIIEAGDSEHGLWLAMRLVRGKTLAELLDTERLEPDAVWEILAPIARALDVAHARELIHRDLTPRNILIAEGGHPYLADFGITKRRGDRSLTKPGQFVGTIEYVAPEQIKDEPAVSATDVYSLSAILFECLCGRAPFKQDNETAVLYAHLEKPPPRASEVNDALPEALDGVIQKGLAKEPDDRYQKASELIADARDAFRDVEPSDRPEGEEDGQVQGGSSGADSVPPANRSPLVRRGIAVALLAAMLLAGGLVAGALANSGGSREKPTRARAGALEVDVPQGWIVRKGANTGFPGLPLSDPVAFVPRRGDAGEVVMVGMSAAVGETLLPGPLHRSVTPPHGVPVSLGLLQGLRYVGLRVKPSGKALTLLASPTSLGVATVACRPAPRGSDLSRACQSLAMSLELRRGTSYPLGPSPSLAQVLQRRVGELVRTRRALRRQLKQARGANSQANAAAALARAFGRCARALAQVPVTPQSAAGLAALVTSLHEARRTYTGLSAEARIGNRRGYRIASDEVSLVESIVDDRLRGLRRLGYQVGTPS